MAEPKTNRKRILLAFAAPAFVANGWLALAFTNGWLALASVAFAAFAAFAANGFALAASVRAWSLRARRW